MYTFSNTMIVQIAKSPKITHLLSLHNSSLVRQVNAASRKSLEFKLTLSYDEERFRSENL